MSQPTDPLALTPLKNTTLMLFAPRPPRKAYFSAFSFGRRRIQTTHEAQQHGDGDRRRLRLFPSTPRQRFVPRHAAVGAVPPEEDRDRGSVSRCGRDLVSSVGRPFFIMKRHNSGDILILPKILEGNSALLSIWRPWGQRKNSHLWRSPWMSSISEPLPEGPTTWGPLGAVLSQPC